MVAFFSVVDYAEEITQNPQQNTEPLKKQPPFIGIITADRVNVRSGDNLNFEVLSQLNKGEKIMVLDRRYGWYKVKLPQESFCYINSDYVKRNDGKGVVEGTNVLLRAGAGTNYTILGKLNQGETVRILDEDNSWYKIEPPEGSVGWVYSNFVEYYNTVEEFSSKEKIEQTEAKVEEVEVPFESGKDNLSESEKLEKEENKKLSKTPIQKTDTIVEMPVATGTVNDLGKIINRSGTHKLIKNGKILYYLRSTDYDLNKYLYYRVSIWGEVSKSPNQKYPTITVTKILIAETPLYFKKSSR